MNEKYVEALEQYDMEVRAVKKGRGSWICETDQGCRLLKEYRGTARRLEFEDEVLGRLDTRGSLRADRVRCLGMQDTDFIVIPQGAYVDAEQVGHFSDCEKVFHVYSPLYSSITWISRKSKSTDSIKLSCVNLALSWYLNSFTVESSQMGFSRSNS